MEKKKLSIKKFQVVKLDAITSVRGGGTDDKMSVTVCTLDGDAQSGLKYTWSILDC